MSKATMKIFINSHLTHKLLEDCVLQTRCNESNFKVYLGQIDFLSICQIDSLSIISSIYSHETATYRKIASFPRNSTVQKSDIRACSKIGLQ